MKTEIILRVSGEETRKRRKQGPGAAFRGRGRAEEWGPRGDLAVKLVRGGEGLLGDRPCLPTCETLLHCPC